MILQMQAEQGIIVWGGDGRIRKCLSENKEQLSTPCKEAMQRAASQQKRGQSKSS